MHSRFQEIEALYRRAFHDLSDSPVLTGYLLKIYQDLVVMLSEASSLQFNTLFARISFITSRYPMSRAWSFALQIPRREMQHRELPDELLLPLLKSCIDLLIQLCRHELNSEAPVEYPKPPALPKLLYQKKKEGIYRKKFARVIAVEWDKEAKQLTILDEDVPDGSHTLLYSVSGVNDLFAEALEMALVEIGMPLVLGLADVECSANGTYTPSYIVILPDLLIDVTAITQMVTDGSDPLALNVMDAFLPSESSPALMTGNIANYILDELIRDIDRPFDGLFAASFKSYPIEFVRMTDEQVVDMRNRLKHHYANIYHVITNRFPLLGIDRQHCVIEPSYYSPRFGIKGRLDLYYEQASTQSASIIELKSNTPFKPNSYGLSSANYHQTLLYDLLIRSGHGAAFKRSNYILYSALDVDTLRYAVSIEALQQETIHNRNQLVLLQFRLMQLDQKDARDVLSEIRSERYPNVKGYLQRNIQSWQQVYDALSPGEQMYLKCFSAFIAREHMLARIGSDKGDGSGGLAGLWLDSWETKEERYQIMRGLTLEKLAMDSSQTIITYSRGPNTNPLANFRTGDIAVMYPMIDKEDDNPTLYQLHRANITYVDAVRVEIRLRNMQVHTGQIEQYRYWNLEHDLLDSSFKALYQSLWALMTADAQSRQIILGLIPPQPIPITVHIPEPPGLTPAQLKIYASAILAGPQYLLWGPPGTGKTSMMLRAWVWYYFHHTSSRIVLMAYTNKAVDEICEALHHSSPEIKDSYIRIGSRAATGEPYKHRLLDQVIAPMTRRAEIMALLEHTRVFVATVSSLQGKSDLFQLISFDVAIMDEASQLLEPAVVGLLTRFKKTILIGDHMQLPAVSVQPGTLSRMPDGIAWGSRIGLTDMSMSYFERLYRLYQTRGWHHLIGILYEQGRMHASIMEFVNLHVYKGLLDVIDPVRQSISMRDIFTEASSQLFQERLIFMPVVSEWSQRYLKTNMHEAQLTIMVIEIWMRQLAAYKLDWTIGVITPFRAQIAAITHLAHQKGLDMERVTIDTVERYQGGARDIIIMSAAVNSQSSLDRITSVNEDQVDRKLNVAITRARQQFILIGDEAILETQPAYAALIKMCARMDPLQEGIL